MPLSELKLIGKPVNHALVPVIAAQVIVAVSGKNLNNAIGKVKSETSGAAEVEDETLILSNVSRP